LALCAVVFTGCAYSLGPTNQQVAGAQSITIEAFPNETFMWSGLDTLPMVARHVL
jgi:hypothetical protein